MTETEIKELYGKSIWDMTPSELIENDLVHEWTKLVDAEIKED